jgi:hypothetical protein
LLSKEVYSDILLHIALSKQVYAQEIMTQVIGVKLLKILEEEVKLTNTMLDHKAG